MSISLRASSGGSGSATDTLALNMPSGTEEGDAVLFFIFVRATSTVTVGAPEGFTVFTDADPANYFDANWITAWAVAGASPPSTVNFTLGSAGGVGYAYVGLSYDGCNSSPIDAELTGAYGETGSSATYACPSVTATGSTDMLVCGFATFLPSQTFTSPSAMNQVGSTETDSVFVTVAAADLLLSSSGSTGAQTCTWSASDSSALIGTTVALKAAGSSFGPAWALGSNAFYGGGGGGMMLALPSQQIVGSSVPLPSYVTPGNPGTELPGTFLT